MSVQKELPPWGTPLSYLTDDRDLEERHKVTIFPGGNGDWYISTHPEDQRMGLHGVRLSTSGGASRAAPGLTIAVARAYRALRGENIEDSFDRLEFERIFRPILANNARYFDWCNPGDVGGQRWCLMYDDNDVASAYFDDQRMAYEAYSKADTNWNCHLWTTAPRDPQKVLGVETSGYLWQNIITGNRTLSFSKDISEQQHKEGWRVYPIGIIGGAVNVI